MSTALDLAIKRLEDQLASQGTKDQPKEGTPEWFVFRSTAVGLTFLRKLKAEGHEGNSQACNLSYKLAISRVKEE